LISAGAIVLGTALMVSLAWGLQHAAMTSPHLLGHTAPDLAIQQLDGQQVGIHQLRGRPVVVNFWASWCGPCVQELPILTDASTAHPGVAFVGADITVTSPEPDTLEVTGLSAAQIGDRARDLNISLHGLAPKKASLEEAFMEMTRDEVEYHAHTPTSHHVRSAS